MTNHPFCCHIAVTLLSRRPSSTTTPPHRAKFAVTLLSHYCHTTITGAISSQKNQLLPPKNQCVHSKIPHIISKNPIFSRKPPLFSRKSPTFSRKCPMFFRKSGTSSKKALTSVAQPCDRCDRKKHKTPGNTRARKDRFTPKDKTSRPFDPFRKLVMAISATPEEKSAVFHQ